MATKKCCNCEKGKFEKNMFGVSEYICKLKNKRVDYSGKCIYGREQERNNIKVG